MFHNHTSIYMYTKYIRYLYNILNTKKILKNHYIKIKSIKSNTTETLKSQHSISI